MKPHYLLLPLLLILLSACDSSAAAPTALIDATWVLTNITYLGNIQTPPPGTNITLTFSKDGHVSGDSGCNSYSGSYVTQTQIIKISGLVSTLRACADQNLTNFEGFYLNKLFEVQMYQRTNNQLKFTFEGDKGTFLFTAR